MSKSPLGLRPAFAVLLLVVAAQAQGNCVVSFPESTAYIRNSIWVKSGHLPNGYHKFQVLYLDKGDTFISCHELGMQESISYQVMKVTDTMFNGQKTGREWGAWEAMIVDGPRPNPPANLQ